MLKPLQTSTYAKTLLPVAALIASISAKSAVLEEVVVTAQKREQSAQDVGIAITAFSGEQLRELGYFSAQQVTALAPGVQTIQPNGPSSYSISIRGVSQNDFTDHQESPVSIYVDEVYVSQMSGAGFMLFDTERVEVLRGPQGTLFGRNATGGLVHYVTRKPSREFDAFGDLTLGSYDQIRFEGAIGGPLGERFAARISVATNHHDPYVDNLAGTDLANGNDYAIRGQALWDISDRASLLVSVRGSVQEIDAGFFEHRAAYPNAQGLGQLLPSSVDFWSADNAANPAFGPAGFLGGVPAPTSCAGCDARGFRDPDDDVFSGAYDRLGHNDLHTWGVTATLKWDFVRFALTSVTDYSSLWKDYIEDSDATSLPGFNFFVQSDVEQFSQELRIDTEGVDWRGVAGFYFLDIDGDYANGGEIPEPAFGGGVIPGLGMIGLDNPFRLQTTSWALFSQFEYDFTPDWTAILGFRWTEETKDHEFTSNVVAFDRSGATPRGSNPLILLPLFQFDKSSAGSTAEIDKGLWSAKAALQWRPNDDWLAYGSWNRGIKAGGFNAPLDVSGLLDPVTGAQDNAPIRFDEEVLNAYEIGFKATLFGGRARLNGSIFYYDYDDYQAFRFIGLTQLAFNADAKAKGVELELAASPVEGLELMVGAAWLDAEVKDLDFGFGAVDRTPVQSPDFNASGLLRYEWLAFGGSLAVQADFTYKSEHYFQLTNAPVTRESGYVVGNARVSYTSGDARWAASFFVNNLADEEYLVQTFDVSSPPPLGFGMTEQYYGAPRWFGGTISYRWE